MEAAARQLFCLQVVAAVMSHHCCHYLLFLRQPVGVVIAGAFVWSVGSFDIFAVHPVSSSAQGSFADPVIVAAVKKHNGM